MVGGDLKRLLAGQLMKKEGLSSTGLGKGNEGKGRNWEKEEGEKGERQSEVGENQTKSPVKRWLPEGQGPWLLKARSRRWTEGNVRKRGGGNVGQSPGEAEEDEGGTQKWDGKQPDLTLPSPVYLI